MIFDFVAQTLSNNYVTKSKINTNNNENTNSLKLMVMAVLKAIEE